MKKKAAPQYATKVGKSRTVGGEWRGKVLAFRGEEVGAIFTKVFFLTEVLGGEGV